MEGFHVATAYITVEPDTSNFDEELRAKLAGDYKLTIDIEPNTDGFREKLKADLEAQEPVQVPVDPDMDGFEEKIQAAVAAASRGEGVDIPVDADLSDASLAAAEEKARVFVASSGGVILPVVGDASTVSFERVIAAAQALADAQPVKLPVTMDAGPSLAATQALIAATDGLTAAGRRAYGIWGALSHQDSPVRRHGRPGITALFGGETTGIMKSVAAWHVLTDVVIEFGAVAIPAIVALGAFSVAAAGDVGDMYTHFENILTITDAMRENMAPLTGGLTALQNAVKPEVYQLAGEAIDAMSKKLGVFQTLATGTGTVLDQLGARAEVAFGAGMSVFLDHAVNDLRELGNVGANVFGIIGNLLKSMPGYAQPLLNVVQGTTGFLETLTSTGFAQGAIRAGLAFHGAAIYIGLAATAAQSLVRGGLTMAGNLLEKASVSALSLGESGEAASASLMGMSAAAAEAAALPWGWILAAAAGVGFLAYQFVTAGDAADAFNARINAAVSAAPLGQTLSAINDGLSQTRQRLTVASAQMHQFSGATLEVGKAIAPVSGGLQDFYGFIAKAGNAADQIIDSLIGFHVLSTGTATAITGSAAAAAAAVHDYDAYRSEIALLNSQSITFRTHLAGLAVEFGGTAQAMGILTAAGITSKQMLSTSAASWAQVMAQVQATTVAYQDMGQAGGILGADMNALDIASSEQATAMSKLNQAWDGTIGIISGGQNAFITFQQDLLSINQAVAGTGGTGRVVTDTFASAEAAAKAAGASMTGLNAASLQLRSTWQSAYGGAETLIDSLRMMTSVSPHASGATKVLTAAMKDSIAELVPFGAQSAATRAELVSLAQEIDPNITSWTELTKWLGNTRNAGSDLNKLLSQTGVNLQDLAADAGSLSASMQSDVTAQFNAAKLSANGTDTAITNLANAMSKQGATARSEHPAMVALYDDLRKDGFGAQEAQSMIEAMTGQIFKIPASHTTKLIIDDSQARAAISSAQAWINAFHGKTVNIVVDVAEHGGISVPGGGGSRVTVPGQAAGGVIPGYAPGRDSVPAMLSPGEGVLVPEAVQALGPAFVHAMNRRYGGRRASGAGRYAGGGITETATFGYPQDVFNIGVDVAAATGGTGFSPVYASPPYVTAAMTAAGKKLADAFASGTLLTLTAIKNERQDALQEIRDYYTAPARAALVAAIKAQTTAMEKLATASAKVSSTISAMKSYAASETSSLSSFSALSNITGGTSSTGATLNPTGAQIQSGLAADLAQLRTFYNLIGSLSKAGVAKSLIAQVVAMGPQPGIAYARAILSGGKKLISEINSEEKQISAVETATGQRAADIQYGQSITAGFLSSLDKEEAALKKRMDSLGQEIAKELAHALGVPLKDVKGLGGEHDTGKGSSGGGSAHHAAKKPGPRQGYPDVHIHLEGSKGRLSHEELARHQPRDRQADVAS